MRISRACNVIAVLMAVFAFIPPAAGQVQFNREKMERDLSIMEQVLGTVLADNEIRDYFRIGGAKGVHLDGYGVVFMMNASTSNYRNEKAQSAQKGYEKMRESLSEFLLDYAAVIKQLNRTDQVSLVINTLENNVWSWTTDFAGEETKEEFKPQSFLMSVRKSDIDAARANNSALESFLPKITFTTIGDEDSDNYPQSLYKSIKVMKSIIETALENKLDTRIDGDKILGTYLKGHGVLFVVNSGSGLNFAVGSEISFGGGVNRLLIRDATDEAAELKTFQNIKVSELEKKLEEMEKELEKKRIELKEDENKLRKDHLNILVNDRALISTVQLKESGKESINKLVMALTETIGDYGHTIRGLNPDENISILYTSTRGLSYVLEGLITSRSSRNGFNIMLTAKFQDIVDYATNKISLETFKNRVTASTFD